MSEYLTKVLENLKAAELLFEAGLYNASANRAYYAAFHAALQRYPIKSYRLTLTMQKYRQRLMAR